jgi:alpha-L-fucosidase
VNYDTRKFPERWEKFKTYTYNQIEELMTHYGKIDILWLDGGWVQPFPSEEAEKKEAEKGVWNQDIDMPKIAKMARSHQPGLIVVDREAVKAYENYRTPEQTIPDKALFYPWESCITRGRQWSYNANDIYTSTGQIIQMLVQIVSRGGNFLLNVGPSPEGDWHPTAYERLKEIGSWMKINGEAIYGTKPIDPYHETKKAFTTKGKAIYAFYLADKDEKNIPDVIQFESLQPQKGSKVYVLGYDKPLAWENAGKGFIVKIPKALQQKPPCEHVWTIKFVSAEKK